MTAPYLAEIRLTPDERQRFTRLIKDVRRTFNLSSSKRPVPHVTLFGPYNTSEGYEAKERAQTVFREYDHVPFRIRGFDAFPDNGVVYASVQPSRTLRNLRQDLFTALEPIAYNYQAWDTNDPYHYHITIAMRLGRKLEDVLAYLRRTYTVDIDTHAHRITALRDREMMWEWDVPRSLELGPDEACGPSWQATLNAVDKRADPTDHRDIQPLSQQTAIAGDDWPAREQPSIFRRLWSRFTG